MTLTDALETLKRDGGFMYADCDPSVRYQIVSIGAGRDAQCIQAVPTESWKNPEPGLPIRLAILCSNWHVTKECPGHFSARNQKTSDIELKFKHERKAA